jgi:hypothetical protein
MQRLLFLTAEFDSWHYQIFFEVVGLDWGQLSLIRITEELLEWKSGDLQSRKRRLTAMGIFLYCEKKIVNTYKKKTKKRKT